MPKYLVNTDGLSLSGNKRFNRFLEKLKTTEVHDVVNLDERDCFCSFMSKDEECIKCDCAHLCREMTKYGERSP